SGLTSLHIFIISSKLRCSPKPHCSHTELQFHKSQALKHELALALGDSTDSLGFKNSHRALLELSSGLPNGTTYCDQPCLPPKCSLVIIVSVSHPFDRNLAEQLASVHSLCLRR